MDGANHRVPWRCWRPTWPSTPATSSPPAWSCSGSCARRPGSCPLMLSVAPPVPASPRIARNTSSSTSAPWRWEPERRRCRGRGLAHRVGIRSDARVTGRPAQDASHEPGTVLTRGTVVIDVDACKGCDLCIGACPPGVLVMTTHEINARGYRSRCSWGGAPAAGPARRSVPTSYSRSTSTKPRSRCRWGDEHPGPHRSGATPAPGERGHRRRP